MKHVAKYHFICGWTLRIYICKSESRPPERICKLFNEHGTLVDTSKQDLHRFLTRHGLEDEFMDALYVPLGTPIRVRQYRYRPNSNQPLEIISRTSYLTHQRKTILGLGSHKPASFKSRHGEGVVNVVTMHKSGL